MKIGLIDVDGHNYPNLALMKISAYHKSMGDTVEWWWGFGNYDRVYMSKIFDDTYTADMPEPLNADEIIKGGTGYGLDNRLPEEIEHMLPDYTLYPELTRDTAYGFLTRGCPNACPFCIVSCKEGRISNKVSDLSELWIGQKNIVLMDPNILACRDHMGLLNQLAVSGAWVDINQGLDARLLTRENIDVLKRIKLKEIHFAWDLMKNSKRIRDTAEGLADCDQQNAAWALRKYAVRDIMDAETVDAVEVVRCKDCKWVYRDPYSGCYYCHERQVQSTHFCSYGERKDGDGNGLF